MKFEVNIEKRYFYLILSVIIVSAGVLVVGAYNTNVPSTFGHSASEIDWSVPGTGTIGGGMNIAGVGTQFQTELEMGDLITCNGATRTITYINSNTMLGVSPNFPSCPGGSSFTFQKRSTVPGQTNFKSVTSDYSLVASDYFVVPRGGGAITITLPLARDNYGKSYMIKPTEYTSANLIMVKPTSPEGLNNAGTCGLGYAYSLFGVDTPPLVVFSDGIRWYTLFTPTEGASSVCMY